jgi:hypothetical protein
MISLRSRYALLLALGAILLPAHAARGADCAPLSSSAQVFNTVSTIELRGIDAATMQGAGNLWGGCNSGGTSRIPAFVTGQTGQAVVTVMLHSASPSASQNSGLCPIGTTGCGCADPIHANASGQLVGTVHLFSQSTFGTDCIPRLVEVLAHELGHSLQLGNVPSGCQSQCSSHIMAQFNPNQPRTDFSTACSRADGQWSVPGGGGGDPPPGCLLFGPSPSEAALPVALRSRR